MPEQVRFPERLRFLRQEKCWTPEEFARMLDSHRSTIVRYEKGDRFPSFHILIQMASLFSVSTDYLLGITDRRGTENQAKINTDIPMKAQMHLREGRLEIKDPFPVFELEREGDLLFVRLESREYMPRYAPKDVWVLKTDVQPANGDQVLLKRGEKTELKTFYQRPNGIILVGIVPYSPPEWFPRWKPGTVIGVLTHVIHSMR